MKKYVAKCPILYAGRNYAPGDEMPFDHTMTPLWLEYDSVAEIGGDANATAAPGRPAGDDRAKALVDQFNRDQLVERAKAAGVSAADIKAASSKPKLAAAIIAAEDAAAPKMLTGHLDAADLATMSLEEITALAADMDADIAGADTVEAIAAILATIPVQAPAGGGNGGGAE